MKQTTTCVQKIDEDDSFNLVFTRHPEFFEASNWEHEIEKESIAFIHANMKEPKKWFVFEISEPTEMRA